MRQPGVPSGTLPYQGETATLAHTIRFGGTLGIARYPEFTAAFSEAPYGPVIVDLTQVESIDSVFLSELWLFRRRRGGAMAVLIAPGGHVARIFEVANIGAKMNVVHDRAAALAALGADPNSLVDS